MQPRTTVWGVASPQVRARVKSPLFKPHFRYVLHWAFAGQAYQWKAETILFPFFQSQYPVHPTVFELQAKT